MKKIITLTVVLLLLISITGIVAAQDNKSVEDLKIGWSAYTTAVPYHAAQVEAAKMKSEELGFELIATVAEGSMVKQISNVEDLLAQGIDLLVLNPKDPKGLVPATKSATRAGVPVIIVDSSIDPSADFVTTVQSNNLRNGELVGEWIAEQMKGKEIKAALISGAQGNPVGKERRQGLIRGITEEQLRSEGKANLKIVAQGFGNWATEGGLTAMEDILVAHPEINLLIGENDSMLLGAMKVLEESDRTDVLIAAAADGQKEAYEAIMDESQYGATGLNDPALIAETAIDIAVEYLIEDKKELPKISYTPAVAITEDNVDEFYNPNAVF